MLNTYGYKMLGLKRAAEETKSLHGYYYGQYIQISYNYSTGEVFTDYHVSLGLNSWTQYFDPAVIMVCFTSEPMTMQEIADNIADKVGMCCTDRQDQTSKEEAYINLLDRLRDLLETDRIPSADREKIGSLLDNLCTILEKYSG